MKVERVKPVPKFEPITITLETSRELNDLVRALSKGVPPFLGYFAGSPVGLDTSNELLEKLRGLE